MKRLILMTTLAAVGAFAQSTGSAQPAQGSGTASKPAVKTTKKHSKKNKKSNTPAAAPAKTATPEKK